ncbi:hypothetical protein FGO68_gene2073 [Halteria grandinella]|uniref:Uncharacterized protein n=1 Tax=Halteria grandinella TaxID=5974 RepID=A0A8J8NUL3_HALGN|nr:hypothetical protein FGO68_gene2073 [Halteria grandinella]
MQPILQRLKVFAMAESKQARIQSPSNIHALSASVRTLILLLPLYEDALMNMRIMKPIAPPSSSLFLPPPFSISIHSKTYLSTSCCTPGSHWKSLGSKLFGVASQLLITARSVSLRGESGCSAISKRKEPAWHIIVLQQKLSVTIYQWPLIAAGFQLLILMQPGVIQSCVLSFLSGAFPSRVTTLNRILKFSKYFQRHDNPTNWNSSLKSFFTEKRWRGSTFQGFGHESWSLPVFYLSWVGSESVGSAYGKISYIMGITNIGRLI